MKEQTLEKDKISRWILKWMRLHIDKNINHLNFEDSSLDYIQDSIMRFQFSIDINRVFGIDISKINPELSKNLYSLHDFIKKNKKTRLEKVIVASHVKDIMPFLSKLSTKIGYFIGKTGVNAYVRVDISGHENLNPGKPYIIVANHASHLDSVVLLHTLVGHRLVFLAAKDYFFKDPWKLRFYKAFVPMLPIHREGIHISDFKTVQHYLHENYSVVIYPEGTRSTTGEMGTFKAGAALLSVQTNIPVVPINIEGAHDLWPKGQIIPKPGKLLLKIGKPIYPPFQKRANSQLLQALAGEYERAVRALENNISAQG